MDRSITYSILALSISLVRQRFIRRFACAFELISFFLLPIDYASTSSGWSRRTL